VRTVMGCGGSTMTLPSEEEVPVIEVPGGSGVVYPLMSVRATIPLKYTTQEVPDVDMADVNAQIASESTTGAGFRLVAFNYPAKPGWMQAIPGMEEPLDVKRKGMLDVSPDSFGMMVFQQVDVPASPLETKVVSSEMSFEISMSLSDLRHKATGYEELWSKLKLLGDEGYSLSAVVDEPGKKMPGQCTASTASGIVSGLASGLANAAAGTLAAVPVIGTVTLVGQRVAGAAPRATTYIVQDVPIETTGHKPNISYSPSKQHQTGEHNHAANKGSIKGPKNIKATMPTLHATLEEHFGPKQCKLAAVYNPSIMDRTSDIDKYVKACHLIFEPTDEPYAVCVVDTAISIHHGKNEGVNYASYLSVIENFVAKGWELAAEIDMPDCAIKTGGGILHVPTTSTVKLVFQAKSNQPGLVTATAPPVPVA
jgi:hypothetical protein